MTTYTTYQAGVIRAQDEAQEHYVKLNILFTGFLLTTFTLANLPLSVLDYMALTTP